MEIIIKDFTPLSPHGERPRQEPEPANDLQISIHSPRMGRDCGAKMDGEGDAISIHSPRMGRDKKRWPQYALSQKFQSTLPAWGETPVSQI